MKATLTVKMRNDRTEALQTFTVIAEVPNTPHTDLALLAVVSHIAAALHGFAPRGNNGNWLPLDVATRVTDCPAGFFAKQQAKEGEANA